jgi:hypothetical protein
MIDPTSSWFKIVELPVTEESVIPMDIRGHKAIETFNNNNTKLPYFNKTSTMISTFVNKTWFSSYPHCQQNISENRSEFNFTSKPYVDRMGSSKSQPVSRTHKHAILERVHEVIMTMLCTAELDMSNTIATSDIEMFRTKAAATAIHSTYHTVLKASPGEASFGKDMLSDIPFLAD